jgi:hypothetical protein
VVQEEAGLHPVQVSQRMAQFVQRPQREQVPRTPQEAAAQGPLPDACLHHEGEDWVLVVQGGDVLEEHQRDQEQREHRESVYSLHAQLFEAAVQVQLLAACHQREQEEWELVVQVAWAGLEHLRTQGRGRLQKTRADALPLYPHLWWDH